MAFSDLRFIFYFLPAFVLLHTLLPQRYKNALLLLSSLGVYAIGAGWEAAAILCGAVLVNHLLACLTAGRGLAVRRAVLALALLVDLGALFCFKYLVPLWNRFGPESPALRIVLPLGVSLYLFQLIASQIDVYRADLEPERSLTDFGVFVAVFPQLTMGPILRYGAVRDTIKERRPGWEDLEQGFRLFVLGLSSKVLLADQFAHLWVVLERIGYEYLSTPLAWLGAVGYSMQLYFDFQGYSLMAMGLGRMLALPIPRNFDEPYSSRSVSEFYRRWHITLGTWFRDYLYIPLGGSRHGTARTLVSSAAVWLLTGLWHGATPNYLIWGGVLFLFVAADKLYLRRALEKYRVLPHILLLFVIVQTWVIFRIEDLGELAAYFSRLYPFFGSDAAINPGDFVRQFTSYWWLLGIGAALCSPMPRRLYERYRGNALSWIPLFALFWLSVYFLATGSGSAFLYFRF